MTYDQLCEMFEREFSGMFETYDHFDDTTIVASMRFDDNDDLTQSPMCEYHDDCLISYVDNRWMMY